MSSQVSRPHSGMDGTEHSETSHRPKPRIHNWAFTCGESPVGLGSVGIWAAGLPNEIYIANPHLAFGSRDSALLA